MLCIVGGGKMGQALAGGLLDKPDHDEVTIVEPIPGRREELEHWVQEKKYLRVSITDAPVSSTGTVIAVKPKDVEVAVEDSVNAGAKRIISIAAGVTLQALHEWAGPGIPVIRAMPNIGATVGMSATAMSPGPLVREDDLLWAEGIFDATGVVVRVQEELMDAVTGLSGSGPGYVFLIAEAMIDAGVQVGLPLEVATKLVNATLSGSAALLAEENAPGAAQLRVMVTTPAGTTAAGLRVFEQRAVRAAMIDAVRAAAERSYELGHH